MNKFELIIMRFNGAKMTLTLNIKDAHRVKREGLESDMVSRLISIADDIAEVDGVRYEIDYKHKVPKGKLKIRARNGIMKRRHLDKFETELNQMSGISYSSIGIRIE